jgi:enoyl-CoA hydratase/carnithine racemase
MKPFEQYANEYETIAMERSPEGILQVTLHTDGDSLHWARLPHEELPLAFRDIGADRDTKVVIVTGTGENFTGPPASKATAVLPKQTPEDWDPPFWEGRQMLFGLLDIEVPVITAMNGPAYRHSELALLNDIVLASEDCVFEDKAHFPNDVLIPGDGIFVIYSLLLGLNRARYFHLTGQRIDAAEALELGLVNEVLPKDAVKERAWALAEEMAQKPLLTLRYTRNLMTYRLKKEMAELLPYGLALEGLGACNPRD